MWGIFRRSDYKTLRTARCLSTAVTERERLSAMMLQPPPMLHHQVHPDLERVRSDEKLSSPKPPPGIVR